MNKIIREVISAIRRGYDAFVLGNEYRNLLGAREKVETAEEKIREAREGQRKALDFSSEALKATTDLVSISLSGKIGGVESARNLPEGFVKGLNENLVKERAEWLKKIEEIRGENKKILDENQTIKRETEIQLESARDEVRRDIYAIIPQIMLESLGVVSKRPLEVPVAFRIGNEIVYSSDRIRSYGISDEELIKIAKGNGLENKVGIIGERKNFDVRLTRIGGDMDLIYFLPEGLNKRIKRVYEEIAEKIGSAISGGHRQTSLA